MTLVEFCEPLFQYVCRLNRLARKGGLVDVSQVRNELRSMLADLKLRAEGAGLGVNFAKVRLPLIYFVDYMVRESSLPFARWWKHLQDEEPKGFSGGHDFFVQLDETLAEQGDEATQRLAVFYNCLALGFKGMYTGHADGPTFLRKKMLEIASRIRPLMDADESDKICPEAYENVDGRLLQIQSADRWTVIRSVLNLTALPTSFVVEAIIAVMDVGKQSHGSESRR
jgi:type IV/VI secretion system ImpK/VasF family protein